MTMQDIYKRYLSSTGICTDTRKIEEGNFFVALSGANFDGNSFVEEAIAKGAAHVLCRKGIQLTDKRIIPVEDTLLTLQELAKHHRKQFQFPLIGITGSNGKTTSKELIRDVLATELQVSATQGNFNNHIGVPLTLLSFPLTLDVGIVEMGANHQGEIGFLCSIAQPDYGYITNIGKAHLEGFGGIEGVRKGKKELFDFLAENGGTAFVPTIDPVLVECAEDIEHIIRFGKLLPPRIVNIAKQKELQLEIETTTGVHEFTTQLEGEYNKNNILIAIAIGMHFEIDVENIKKAIANYRPENNRSQWYISARNKVIMDAYNANPSSMAFALENLKQYGKEGLAILGDMFEMGEYSLREHQVLVNYIREHDIDAILIGKHFGETHHNGLKHFSTTDEARKHLQLIPPTERIILLKGSRGIALETLKDLL